MSRTFAFRKRWGAELLDDRNVCFRLWAPGIAALEVVGRDDERLPMAPADDGWFEIVTDRIRPGDGYGYRLPDGTTVPDPAARAQLGDVHGPSQLVDPGTYRWRSDAWRGRPWHEAVICEIHPGTFSEEGTFAGIEHRLDHIVDTGFTAIEIMPVAQFGGYRGWGYDGVLPYAPHRAFGGPCGLKSLVDAAHERGVMMLLDVVYNHFGPDGNYLHLYAPVFFDESQHTPWGAAIAYERAPVREFFIDNALYWLEEFRFDGLRFDAINEIKDLSEDPLLEEIGRTVRARITDRHIHLTTEDDRNITRLHERDAGGRPGLYTAEWNDDFHHAAHVVATGEDEGYYVDYVDDTVARLVRTLAEGFAYQGEPSHFWGDVPRGEPSAHLPPTAFVNFLQNHDQIGNRAFNERLIDLAPARCVEALTAILLLGPHIPLMFMGEEWGETRPFGFFTDFEGDLATAVREGRRREFKRFARFADEANRAKIPDPNAFSTFAASRLDWAALNRPGGYDRHAFVKTLLGIRRDRIVPHLDGVAGHAAVATAVEGRSFGVRWRLAGADLVMLANLDDTPSRPPWSLAGDMLFDSASGAVGGPDKSGALPGWSVVVWLERQRQPDAGT